MTSRDFIIAGMRVIFNSLPVAAIVMSVAYLLYH